MCSDANRDDHSPLNGSFVIATLEKKAIQSQKSGQGCSAGINLKGCTSFSETTVMSDRRKSILVCFPFGYMRIPAVNTREQQKKWEKAINLKLQHIKHTLTVMTQRKDVLVDSLFRSCKLKVSCLYLKHLVLHASRLDGPLLLVCFFAILCCIMHQ